MFFTLIFRLYCYSLWECNAFSKIKVNFMEIISLINTKSSAVQRTIILFIFLRKNIFLLCCDKYTYERITSLRKIHFLSCGYNKKCISIRRAVYIPTYHSTYIRTYIFFYEEREPEHASSKIYLYLYILLLLFFINLCRNFEEV